MPPLGPSRRGFRRSWGYVNQRAGRRGREAHQIKAHGARVMLLGVRLRPRLGAYYMRAFEAIYPRLAEELSNGVRALLHAGRGWRRGAHAAGRPAPTAEGHARIADALLLPTKRWLGAQEPLPEAGP